MIDGTPVLDIKPYIADYDSPQNLSVHNDHQKLRAEVQADGNSCDQRLLSGCGKAQLRQSTKERPKCLEDRTSGENAQKSREMSEIQHTLPEDRERAVGLALEPSRGESMDKSENQLGPLETKSSLEEGTDRPRKVDGASVLPGSSAETQWDASCCARTADRVPCSVVPSWVTEAPVAPLQVRFTPHAEMDLRKLSSGGECGYPASPSQEVSVGILGLLGMNERYVSYCAGKQDVCVCVIYRPS